MDSAIIDCSEEVQEVTNLSWLTLNFQLFDSAA